jgi:uncharacterized protein YicC (UPF0701 family)
MRSMTGYGEAAAQGRSVKVVVQLRTLNHRNLDMQIRVPREYLSLEEEVRKRVRESIDRGRVEIFITRSLLKGQTRTLELDHDLLGQYVKSLRRAKKQFGLKGDVDIALFSSLPELFRLREAEAKEDNETDLVIGTLAAALANLDRSRQREGGRLRADVRSQVRQLKGIVSRLVAEAKRGDLRGKDPRPPRDEVQTGEFAPAAGQDGGGLFKGDIHEEVVRLKSHVSALGGLAASQEPVGKKIDFLLQEIQRELNTIGSKAPELPVVRLVLVGKGHVEKIREQVQNIE